MDGGCADPDVCAEADKLSVEAEVAWVEETEHMLREHPLTRKSEEPMDAEAARTDALFALPVTAPQYALGCYVPGHNPDRPYRVIGLRLAPDYRVVYPSRDDEDARVEFTKPRWEYLLAHVKPDGASEWGWEPEDEVARRLADAAEPEAPRIDPRD